MKSIVEKHLLCYRLAYSLLINKPFQIYVHDYKIIIIMFLFQEVRELQELQRTLYTFLHVITTHDLSPVFLLPKCEAYLDPVMQLLLFSSCNHKDILVRKVCVVFSIYSTGSLFFLDQFSRQNIHSKSYFLFSQFRHVYRFLLD